MRTVVRRSAVVIAATLAFAPGAHANDFVRYFGGPGSGNGQFTQPLGVAVDPRNGDLYVTDASRNLVEKFDSGSNFLSSFGGAGSGPGQFNHPAFVAIDPSNRDVYVTDITNNRVEKLDPDGNFLSQFGSAGTGNGQFNAPNGIAVDPSNSDVYVTDFNNQRVQKFHLRRNVPRDVWNRWLWPWSRRGPVRSRGRSR